MQWSFVKCVKKDREEYENYVQFTHVARDIHCQELWAKLFIFVAPLSREANQLSKCSTICLGFGFQLVLWAFDEMGGDFKDINAVLGT